MTARQKLTRINDELADFAEGILDRAEARKAQTMTPTETATFSVILDTLRNLNEVIDDLPAPRYPSEVELRRLYLRGGSPSALIAAIDREYGIR
jgi:hypothetical protein